jgi:hypothetical protein
VRRIWEGEHWRQREGGEHSSQKACTYGTSDHLWVPWQKLSRSVRILKSKVPCGGHFELLSKVYCGHAVVQWKMSRLGQRPGESPKFWKFERRQDKGVTESGLDWEDPIPELSESLNL